MSDNLDGRKLLATRACVDKYQEDLGVGSIQAPAAADGRAGSATPRSARLVLSATVVATRPASPPPTRGGDAGAQPGCATKSRRHLYPKHNARLQAEPVRLSRHFAAEDLAGGERGGLTTYQSHLNKEGALSFNRERQTDSTLIKKASWLREAIPVEKNAAPYQLAPFSENGRRTVTTGSGVCPCRSCSGGNTARSAR